MTFCDGAVDGDAFAMDAAGESKHDRVHLIGIGGMHMSAIAQILLARGAKVSGCDLVQSALTGRLQQLGARVFAGHDAAHLDGAELVVTTAAAKATNAELIAARERGLPVLLRHEMVARLMEGRTGVAIAGTHGKTTTSSLVAVLLQHGGRDPTYLLGGESLDLGGNAGVGAGPHVVVEADEYAGAFLAYHPALAVVTNVERDHLDYFGSDETLLQAFRRFVDNVSAQGILIACADSPPLRRMLPPEGRPVQARLVWYGLDTNAESGWRALDISPRAGGGSDFTIAFRGRTIARASILLPGRHNVSNALAAFVAGYELGLDPVVMLPALAAFRGAKRRFELVGDAAGVTVVDDYAHHPTEVAATLAAARARYPGRRLVVLFQPHTFSRTQYLLDGFCRCFDAADDLYLLQTFAARETPEAGLDARALAAALPRAPLGLFDSVAEAAGQIAPALRPGDVFFTMGAGDVTQVGRPLLEELRRR